MQTFRMVLLLCNLSLDGKLCLRCNNLSLHTTDNYIDRAVSEHIYSPVIDTTSNPICRPQVTLVLTGIRCTPAGIATGVPITSGHLRFGAKVAPREKSNTTLNYNILMSTYTLNDINDGLLPTCDECMYFSCK